MCGTAHRYGAAFRRRRERGFARKPTVPRLRIVTCAKTLYEHPGGDAALHRVEEIFYDKILAER
jgi:hypothetical protein